jgi:hypothetical protein
MFKIIGDDGNEYGPVESETIRRWIAERRAVGRTRLQAEGSTDWKPLSEFPEFAEALAAAPPPPIAPAMPAPAGSPVLSIPSSPTPPTCGLAVASLVCGILGVCSMGITALVGLVLGILAINKISRSGGRLGGNGLAIAGISVSGAMLLLLPIQAAMLLPALSRAKSKAQTINCANNLKQLNIGLRMYATDHDEKLPAGNKWCDAISQEIGAARVFRCPADPSDRRCSYAFNARLSGVDLTKVNSQTVMLFESNAGWNACGGPDFVTIRHRPVLVVALVDGSVQQYHGDPRQLRWDP